jgi:PAS domain S-box-containing protein
MIHVSSPDRATVAIDDVIITPDLWSRPNRAPDFEAENRALTSLAAALSESPESIFQKLVDAARELCQAGSAGISLLEGDVFRWRATSGEYTPYLGETLPRYFSPCGTVLDRNACLLMSDPVRFFPYIEKLLAPVREVLLIPFHDGSTPIGTLWVVGHDAQTRFNSEDVRVLTSLTKFGAIAVSLLGRVRDAEKVQDEVREVRVRMESTLIAGEIGTWVYDIEQDQVRADRNLARMFGVDESAAVGGPLEAYTRAIHPDDRPRVEHLINQAIQSGSTFESEYRLLSAGGKTNWVVARGTVERDSEGRTLRLPGVVVDITSRKHAEQLLRASENRRRLALDAGELGTWNIDPATSRLTSDDRFRQIFSGNSDEITYEEAFARLHPDDLARIRDGVAAATRPEDPTPYVAEYRVVRPDGSVRWVFAQGRSNFVVENGHRRLDSFDGTVVDVTERKNMENELRRIAAALSEAGQRKDEFLATLAHELRNPLAPIRSGLSVLRMGTLSADDDEVVGIMERQVNQLVHLVNDLLDVARVTTGKVVLRREKVALQTVIQAAVETNRPVMDASAHSLRLNLPADPIFVDADPTRISQVITNLLNNAAKYTPPRGQIMLSLEREGGEAVVRVADNGVGIPAELVPKVFDMFMQVGTSLERSQGGLGLGLTLVRRLVEMHEGSVHAESGGPAQGSTFTIRLPTSNAQAPQQAQLGVEKARSGQASRKILIVEDNVDGAKSLSMLLSLNGHNVRVAHTGLDGLKMAIEWCPEVVLMDIGLPGLNGYEVAEQLRKVRDKNSLMLVALSGWGREEDRQKAERVGFDAHLTKPVNPDDVQNLLKRVSHSE